MTPVDQAVAPKVPTNNKRIEYMAAAPIAVLLAPIGLALLSPIRDERVWAEYKPRRAIRRPRIAHDRHAGYN